MKRNILLALLALSTMLVGCRKFLDINENPSLPQNVKAELLLAPIIFQMGNGVAQDLPMVNKFNQTVFGSSADDASRVWERHGYRSQSDVGGVMWRMVYFNHGRNLALMVKDAIENEKYEYAAIGYAVKAWGYQMLTDYHGPVILDEALRDQLSFTYQDQKEVYAKVRLWCDSALFFLDQKSPLDYSGSLSSEKGDNLFRGNMERWRKFIYAIKATQYIHLINKPDFASKYADSVVYFVDKSFSSNADDANIKFAGDKKETSSVAGPMQANFTSTYYSRAGQPIVNYLGGGLRGTAATPVRPSVDPRLVLMLNPTTVDSTYTGGVPNVANGTVPHIMGKIIDNVYEGRFIFRDKVDFPLMTYAQLQLIKAEALFIKGDKDGAYDAYLKAIRSHMTFVNKYASANEAQIKEVEIVNYLKSSEIPQVSADLTLADIMGQKYIVQWGWGGMEQWCDLRKYKYDVNVFKQFQPLSGASLQYREYCYRVRPRYNSEYAWNATELDKWGALDPTYVIKPTWSMTADN
ncbi:SusD/RagB family nutrient-binding outer membrane lipoprotein [Sphingobacterium psychroaquaticum]|uniref:Starch-binding associating with outer membrane n=1 Tax=Sphingobacterium psychroaquaticum TaxID=561061 RepID=A0A1X7L011_9SPHI|nr:SusD/RagB family nutrient-binding outer membrane lipoprotein [Sphingobacterium psychroaquaticum]QBQ39732.1 SusD/RagB family nutrient-binding outer membrane lipoprotein [Sphingobacterium psychroaquaticum]SMG46824.1 Starch-binding associating with outer membrane [Sphingobacterium psychroaquaticum]